MTASQQRAPRGVNPSVVSLDNVGVSPGIDDVVVGDTIIQDDFARRRADNLDAEAAHYRHRAIQEERALGPGYYVDLLRDMAADRATMASGYGPGTRPPQIRLEDSFGNRRANPPFATRSQLIDVPISTYATTVADSALPGGGSPPATAPIRTANLYRGFVSAATNKDSGGT
jgi:hypothetical protein